MIDKFLFQEADPDKHIIATYFVKSPNLTQAAKAIAIGQSIGNPDVRTQRESPELLRDHLARIVNINYHPLPSLPHSQRGTVQIAYPLVNFGERDGVSQLLCTLMGGQMDIDAIQACRLEDVSFPLEYLADFQGPKFGMQEIRKRAKVSNRPLLGGIVKPKTGISVSQLEQMTLELLEGGVDFIKEDEVLGDPACCSFNDRLMAITELVNNYNAKQGREVFYAFCINGDDYLDRAEAASEAGANAFHLNFWAGLGAYRRLRDLDLNTAIFFQKSGDKILTSKKNAYSMDFSVIAQLARMSGADFIHAGMWGGYLSDPQEELDKTLSALRSGFVQYNQTIPSLSCGSRPGLVDTTISHYGIDLMMNVGGSIQGHPMGTTAGAVAMRQAMAKPPWQEMVDYMEDKSELKTAIQKWGYTPPDSGEVWYKEG